MTQTEFIKSEIKKYLKELYLDINDTELENKFNKTRYYFNEDKTQILLELPDYKQGIALDWSDNKGIYSAFDEDEEFDINFQES